MTQQKRLSVGQQLKSIREQYFFSMSKSKLSKLTGLSRQVIIDIEAGKTNYKLDSLIRYRDGIRNCKCRRSENQHLNLIYNAVINSNIETIILD